MGTDITFFVERLAKNGRWELAEEPVPNLDAQHAEPGDFEPDFRPMLLELPRNSKMFATLAGVSNGRFGSFESIAAPRGLPDGLSRVGADWYRRFGENAFSASWLSPLELDKFKWDESVTLEAMVHPEAAHLFSEEPCGFPTIDWPVGIEVSYAEFRSHGVKVRWKETYRSAGCYDILQKQLRRYRSNDEYRYVFWFDA